MIQRLRLRFHCRGHGLLPGFGKLRFHMLYSEAKKKLVAAVSCQVLSRAPYRYIFFYSVGLNPLSSECDACLYFRTEVTEIQRGTVLYSETPSLRGAELCGLTSRPLFAVAWGKVGEVIRGWEAGMVL